MYAYITGKIAEKSPTYVVLDNQGIGYCINITLNTFTAIGEKEEVRLYVHEQILEDAHNLFGFFTAKERDLFELLISVSGVGCNTSRERHRRQDCPTHRHRPERQTEEKRLPDRNIRCGRQYNQV